ncbi:unnamed protein product, partial [Ectocarpus sp. 12 AP-2014]
SIDGVLFSPPQQPLLTLSLSLSLSVIFVTPTNIQTYGTTTYTHTCYATVQHDDTFVAAHDRRPLDRTALHKRAPSSVHRTPAHTIAPPYTFLRPMHTYVHIPSAVTLLSKSKPPQSGQTPMNECRSQPVVRRTPPPPPPRHQNAKLNF